MKPRKKLTADNACAGCEEIELFSFKGCAVTCERFIAHIKEVFNTRVSPCKDLRCRVPGVSPKKRKICSLCPLPELFSISLGEGPKCVLGKKRDQAVYKSLWEIRRDL